MVKKGATKDISEFEELLTRYFDDEATEEEASSVKKRLQEDTVAQSQLLQLEQVHDLMRESYASELSQIDFGDFWAGVEAGIERLPARESASRPLVVREPGAWERLHQWFAGLAWRPIAVGAMTIAIVASFGLFRVLLPPDVSHEVAENDLFVQDGELVDAADDALPGVDGEDVVAPDEAQLITEGVEVTSVSDGATVMVIHAPEQATIIWIDVDDASGGTSI